MLLHDNKGIKDKFTPHTPYPAIVCLLGGPRVTRICHFNLLTSRGERQGHSVRVSVQINEAESSRDEYPCMLSFRDEIFLAEGCQHVCPLSLLINPIFFFSTEGPHIITLQSKLLNRRIHRESTFQHKHDCWLDREVGFKEEILKTHCFGGELNCERSQQWNNGG